MHVSVCGPAACLPDCPQVSVEDQEDCESGSSYSGYSYSYCDDLFQLQVGGGSDIPMVAVSLGNKG